MMVSAGDNPMSGMVGVKLSFRVERRTKQGKDRFKAFLLMRIRAYRDR
jgi:hypothetical protein